MLSDSTTLRGTKTGAAEVNHSVDDPGFSMLTDERIEDLLFIWGRDGAAMCEDALSIVSEEAGKVIEFIPTDEQRLILKVIDTLRAIGVQVRVIIDKPRQIYATTAINADGFRCEYLSPHPFFRVIMADKYSKTENLYNANLTFVREMPEAIRPPLLPNRSSLKLIYPDTNAHLSSYSAESSNEGRSGTIHYLHLSECAFYPRFREMSEGLLNCVPDLPGTSIIWETTANGFDQGFHPQWVSSLERAKDVVRRWNASHPERQAHDLVDYRGRVLPDTAHIDLILRHRWWDGSYVPLFFTWTGMRKYRRPAELEQLTMDVLSPVERGIVDAHGLDLDQLAWRRYKIRETFRGQARYSDDDPACVSFRQEYPLTWEESFVTKSGTFFDRSIISLQLERTTALERRSSVVNGKVVREIKPATIHWVKDHEPKFSPNGSIANRGDLVSIAKGARESDLVIYKAPQTPRSKPKPSLWTNRYVIGADIAEGLAQGDHSVAAVFDRVAWEFVAEYCGHIRPLQFAELLAQLSAYYDNCWVMGEYNDQGPSVVPRLLDYTSKVMGRPEIGRGVDLQNPKAFWFQTTASRQMGKEWAVGLTDELVRRKPTAFPFRGFWIEAGTFVRHSKTNRLGADGKTAGQDSSKNFDDRIMGYSMALIGNLFLPAPSNTRKSFHVEQVDKKVREKNPRSEHMHGMSALDDAPPTVRGSRAA